MRKSDYLAIISWFLAWSWATAAHDVRDFAQKSQVSSSSSKLVGRYSFPSVGKISGGERLSNHHFHSSPRWLNIRGGGPRIAPRTVSVPWQKTASQGQTDSQRAAKETMDAFLTRDSRNTFIARVYAILAAQMLVTAASIYVFGTNDWASNWLQSPGFGAAVPGLSLLLSTIAWFVMCGSTSARRSSPLKWQLLALFTLGEALSAGFLTSFFKFESVVTAMLTTAAATTIISIYTATQRNSKYDLSQWGTGLTQAGLIFLFLGVIQLLEVLHVLPKGFLPVSEKAYCFFGTALFSFYVAHHTKTLVGGKHTKYQMNEKDYVFGAMTLYNDIISLFTYLLRIVGEDRE
ncbi:hypothetical protein ACA910_015219 [Epithemia clementina (nom. ined.)]